MSLPEKKGTFIHGDRKVHIMDIPADEVEEFLEQLREQVERAKPKKKPRPGFIDD